MRPEPVWEHPAGEQDMELEKLEALQEGALLLLPGQWRGSRAE